MEDTENLRIELSPRFNNYLNRAPDEIKEEFAEALELFREEPNHPQLRNHALKDKYADYRSINVNDDWRSLYKIRQTKKRIIITFQILGTHPQLYS